MATRRYRKSRKSCKYGKLKRPVRTKSGRKRKCKKKRKRSSKRRKRKTRKSRKRKSKKKRRKHKVFTYSSRVGGTSMGVSSDGSMSYGYSDPSGSTNVSCVIM